MKILAIRINNLASLEGRTEIDFTIEPLCSAGIFAITGPTGAPNSTLLLARLIFQVALYLLLSTPTKSAKATSEAYCAMVPLRDSQRLTLSAWIKVNIELPGISDAPEAR